jgi:transposase InsO family protein
MMRYSQAEKMEIIRLVEESELPVKQTLAELEVPRSSFYRWYQRYRRQGYTGLADRKIGPRRFWNRIPQAVRQRVVEVALARPDQSPRQLAWHITDTDGYFISESSVYRILKGFDLITSPVYELVTASDSFKQPTRRVNELWQTDFTQFKVFGWGWYYLCTVLDDFSRYILAWRLASTMGSGDVEQTLDIAVEQTGVTHIQVEHRPRLLSDNGSAFVSEALASYLDRHKIQYVRGAPYHPQTQGKIERYHRSMKNIVKLDTFYFPWELKQAIANFVVYYNNERYHEALNNLTPADVYFGRAKEVLSQRQRTKQHTLRQRRRTNLRPALQTY